MQQAGNGHKTYFVSHIQKQIVQIIHSLRLDGELLQKLRRKLKTNA